MNAAEITQFKTWNPISLHSNWDSSWYIDIAKNGYTSAGPGKLSNIVFFSFIPDTDRCAAAHIPKLHPGRLDRQLGLFISLAPLFIQNRKGV